MFNLKYVLALLGVLCFINFSTAQDENRDISEIENKATDALFNGASDAAVNFFRSILNSEFAESSDKIRAYIGISQAYLKKERLDSVDFYNSKANKLFQSSESTDLLLKAKILDNYGHIESRMIKFEEALDYYYQALQLKESLDLDVPLELATSYLNIARIQSDINQYEASELSLKRAQNLINCFSPRCNVLKASILKEQGTLLYLEGLPDEALIVLNEALVQALEVFNNENIYLATFYNILGIVYMEKQRIYQGIDYLNKALAINISQFGLDQHFTQAKIHSNLGIGYYLLGEKEQALHHTNKTLQMGINAFGNDFPELFYPYSQLGQIYGDAQGLPYLLKASELAKRTGDKNRISHVNRYLAILYYDLGEFENALFHAQESLKYREAILNTNNITIIRNHELLAKIYLRIGKLDESLYHNSISLVMNASTDLEVEQVDESSILLEDCLDKESLIIGFNQRSRILYEKYLQNKLQDVFAASLNFSQQCMKALDSFDYGFQNPLDEQSFNNLVKNMYGHHVSLLLEVYDHSPNPSTLKEAFFFSERGTAQLLGKLIKRTELLNQIDNSNALISKDFELKTKLSVLTNLKVTETQKETVDSTVLYDINGQIRDVQSSLDSIENAFETMGKAYLTSIKLSPEPIENIQEILSPEQTLVKFFNTKNELVVFIVSNESFDVYTMATRGLKTKIKLFNKALRSRDYKGFLDSSKAVYKQLFEPLETFIIGNELLIIPDEFLWNLSFDLLTRESLGKRKMPDYLLYDYAISYVNSASIFYNYGRKKKQRSQSGTIGFSYNPVSLEESSSPTGIDSNYSQQSLPGTEAELKAISKYLDGDFYLGSESDETTFKHEASKYNIVHLALHAEADSLKSNNLKILFSGQQDLDRDDNILYSHEIYNMNLDADMVVLSACNSGIGKIDNGEGIQSLGNAFQQAGSQSLVLTKWNISDKSTPYLIEQFYMHLKSGKSKSKALQKAKIDFLSSASVLELNPYYWGSFYVLGDPSAIPVVTKNVLETRYLLMLFFLLMIILVFFNIFKR